MRSVASSNWYSIALCSLISGLFLSFVLHTFFIQTLLTWLLGAFAIYTGICTKKFGFQCYSVFLAALFLLRMIAYWRQPELKFSDIEQSLSFILFPAIFSIVKVSERQWNTIQKVVVIGFSAYLCVALYNFITHVYLQELFHESLVNAKRYYPLFLKQPFMSHPSFLAVILAPSIPMCFSLAANAAKQWQQWLWLVFVPLLVFVVFVSGSRIGLVVTAALVILCSIWFFRRFNIVSKIGLLVVFVATIGIFRLTAINYTHDPIRSEMNRFAIEKIKERPLWGYGYGTQNAQLNEAFTPETVRNPFTLSMGHFHNTYLDEPFQFGLIGALPFVLLVLYLIYLGIKNRDFFLFSFLAIYLLFFAVELPFNSVKGVMPMMLLLGLIMNTQRERMSGHPNKKELCQ